MDYFRITIYIFYLFSIHLVASKIVVEAKDESSLNNAVTTSTTSSDTDYDYDYSCSEGQHECNPGECIENSQLCDGFDDCSDGSDELNCPTNGDYDYGCSSGQIDCGGGECIETSQLCDGYEDCSDGHDERNCSKPTVPACTETQFTCGDNSCIPKESVCDGTSNCPDGKDEQECRQNVTTTVETTTTQGPDIPEPDCGAGEFFCEFCLPANFVCDGFDDCFDGADEMNCPPPLPSNTITTRSSLSSTVKGSITASPVQFTTRPSSTCGLNEYQCYNGNCISKSNVCDGRSDCSDGSDEISCPTTPVHTKSSKNTLKCEHRGKEYPAGTEIVKNECSGITCTDDARVVIWTDAACGARPTAKTNFFLLVLVTIGALLNWR